MSDTDRRPNEHWLDRDSKEDRERWQRRFRHTVRMALVAQEWDRADRRWRRTSGWLTH